MTDAARRRRLLDRLGPLTADFGFDWVVPAAVRDPDGTGVSVYPTADDPPAHTLAVFDLLPPGPPLAGLAVRVTAGDREYRFRTDAYGLAELTGLPVGGRFRLTLHEAPPVTPTDAFLTGHRVSPAFVPELAADTGDPPRQDFPADGPVRRLVLRRAADGAFTATVEVDLTHPQWPGGRLARLRFVTATNLVLTDGVFGLTDKSGEPQVGVGELNLDRLDPTASHAGGRDAHVAVTAETPAKLGPDAYRLLERSRKATDDPAGQAVLTDALAALDAAEAEVVLQPQPQPPPPEPPPPPVPPPPAGPDVTTELIRLRALFEQKILRDQGQQQIIAKLHESLKEAQADLVFKILRPVLLELIRLYDDLSAKAAAGGDHLADFAQDVEDLLYRLGVGRYECPGDRLDPKRQTVRRTRPADDPAEVGRVVERLRPGFEYNAAVVLRPEEVTALATPPRPTGPRP